MTEEMKVPDGAPAGVSDSTQLLGRCSVHGMPRNIPTDCSGCRGEGVIEDDQDYGPSPPFVPCWQCKGTGTGIPECEMCLIEDDEA